jgi:hypothetical protein
MMRPRDTADSGDAMRIAVALITAVVLAAVAAGAYVLLRPKPFEIQGDVSIPWIGAQAEVGPCTPSGGYGDIGGAQVVVSDAAGKTIATGNLPPTGRIADLRCVFDFEVKGIPGGHDFYGVAISHRGRLQYRREQLDGQVLKLNLGS